MKIETIETARLALRGFTPEDAPFAMSLWNDPDTGRWLSDPALEEIPDLAAYTKSVEGLGDSLDCCHLVAVDRATGQRIGTCSFVPENGGRSYDIAYAVRPDFQRQGYGTCGDHPHRPGERSLQRSGPQGGRPHHCQRLLHQGRHQRRDPRLSL